MERVKKLALGLSALIFSSVACANFSLNNFWEGEWQFSPSVGFDANVRHQPFDSRFGEEQFRENYPDTNVYLAVRLHEYFGIEGGYEYMYRQHKTQFYNGVTPVLGFFPQIGDDSKLYFSDVHSNGWNLNLVGFWPICPRTGTDVTFTVGVAWMKMYYETVAVTEGILVSEKSGWESDRRAKLRAGIGLKQMITDNFGARLQVMWEKTSDLGASTAAPSILNADLPATLATDFYTVEPKNSVLFGLGFFLQFC